ncbi:hypothetical protein CSW58_07015 [Caulobacter sp. B11]|uniref:hypothetical protein n=1 Tax=Caulobacter sp. B11 TaxID=2048899 RepID=UPI000C12BFE1|nr:hypothetical protein [Caulobacter sp. B11]PHY13253.1 hypothetical protein CSW58_07015 [Caulobacter sp. B11]
MTAINAFIEGAVVYLITDGALCKPDGTIGGYGQKVTTFAHLNAAMAVRGHALHHLAASFAADGGGCKKFEDLLDDQFVADMKHWLGRFAPVFADEPFTEGFDLVLAGWSDEAAGPVIYRLSDIGSPSAKAWTWVSMTVFAAPMDQAIQDRLAARSIHLSDFRPLEHGLALLEEQRTYKEPLGEGEAPASGVGVFAQVTTITKGFVGSSVIRWWEEDVFGGPVGGAAP